MVQAGQQFPEEHVRSSFFLNMISHYFEIVDCSMGSSNWQFIEGAS